jgi:hypothetical protein
MLLVISKESSLNISQVPASTMQHQRQSRRKETFLIKSIVEKEKKYRRKREREEKND